MANIIFCFPPIISTINSSLRLARDLQQAGHNVNYVGIKDCEPTISDNGFNFTAVYPQWFPQNWFADYYLKSQSADADSEHYARQVSKQFNSFLDYIISGGDDELKQAFDAIQPDLIIISTSGIDSLLWALLAHKFKLKSVYMFDVLGGTVNYSCPPVFTDIIATGSLWSAIKNCVIWQVFKFKKQKFLNQAIKNNTELFSFARIKQLAGYCNYPQQDIDILNDMPAPHLKIPEFIVFPKAFEFPKVINKNRYYTQASVDLARKQISFPWDRVNPNQTIVYVALGTLPLLTQQDYIQFFQTIIKTASHWPQWNWILSIGNHLNVEQFNPVPPNIIIVNRAPQLEILKQADLMITHGGPNSVKECILAAVPMIVFPLWFDQPGNVARVVYHGLGLKGNFKTLNAETLTALVSEISQNPQFKQRLIKMQQAFLAAENSSVGIDLINQLIAQPAG